MGVSSVAFTVLALLATSFATVFAGEQCARYVSQPIVTMLDNGTLFSTCATEESGGRVHVNSLFDVLKFSDPDFLTFCRASNCIKPVRELLHVIPTDCLITYHGSAHNLSEEVATLHHECLEATGVANMADADEVYYRYFLDY